MTGRCTSNSSPPRPRRRAANTHFFRYLQTNNPTKLEENDLKRALEASLEESSEFWLDDSTSSTTDTCSSMASGSCSNNNGKMFVKKKNHPSINGQSKPIKLFENTAKKYAPSPHTSPRKSVDGPLFKQKNSRQEKKARKRRGSTASNKVSVDSEKSKCSARRLFHLSSTDSCSTSTKSSKKLQKTIPQLYKDVVPETNGFLTLLCLPKQMKPILNRHEPDDEEEEDSETFEQTLDLVIDPERFNKKLVELSCLSILPPSHRTRHQKNSIFHHSARKRKLIKATTTTIKHRASVVETRKLRQPRPNITECIKSEFKTSVRQTRASANIQCGPAAIKTRSSNSDIDSNPIYGCSSVETPESITSSSSTDASDSVGIKFSNELQQHHRGPKDLPENIRHAATKTKYLLMVLLLKLHRRYLIPILTLIHRQCHKLNIHSMDRWMQQIIGPQTRRTSSTSNQQSMDHIGQQLLQHRLEYQQQQQRRQQQQHHQLDLEPANATLAAVSIPIQFLLLPFNLQQSMEHQNLQHQHHSQLEDNRIVKSLVETIKQQQMMQQLMMMNKDHSQPHQESQSQHRYPSYHRQAMAKILTPPTISMSSQASSKSPRHMGPRNPFLLASPISGTSHVRAATEQRGRQHQTETRCHCD